MKSKNNSDGTVTIKFPNQLIVGTIKRNDSMIQRFVLKLSSVNRSRSSICSWEFSVFTNIYLDRI